MEVADGFGGYRGVTDWTARNVQMMWEMLAPVQPDVHWQQVDGWKKIYELAEYHMANLKQYRDRLVEVWPPEKSAAAKEYVSRLDFLIQNVQGTYDTAVANHTLLSSVTLALSSARADLEKLNQEYTTKLTKKQQWDKSTAELAEAGFTGAANDKPPVTDAELEQLNQRARTLMFSLSGELAQAQVQLQKPPVYKQPYSREKNPSSEGENAGPPMIPPVTALPDPAVNASSVRGHASTSPTAQISAPTGPSLGPILGSAGTLAPTAPIQAGTIIPPAGPTATGGGLAPAIPPSGILPPAAGKLGLPGGGFSTIPPSGAKGLTGEVIKPGGPTSLQRPMPPGGMIGGPQGNTLGQPGYRSNGARRVNPVGGMIGEGAGTSSIGGAGQRPSSGRIASGSSGFATGQPADALRGDSARRNTPRVNTGAPSAADGHPLGTGSRSRSMNSERDEHGRSWDPDNPWEVDEGVMPVVLPPANNGYGDPGPAIGLNR
jgi:hypothetical protein